jgi:hypothetical protein
VSSALLNPLDNCQHRLRFQVNAQLRLIIKWPIQAASIQIDAHGKKRMGTLVHGQAQRIYPWHLAFDLSLQECKELAGNLICQRLNLAL